MKFLNIESPFMQAMGKVADLMWLNVLTLLLSIPIFTAGASLTALHYMALKIVRNEECYVTREYFRAFRQNFKQSTLIWLLMMVIIGLLAGDYYVFRHSEVEFGNVMQMVILFLTVVVAFTLVFVFPVQAKFENTILRTIKNAFFISVVLFPKTILMIALYAMPVVLASYFPQIIPISFLLGLSGPAWLSAKLYNKFFSRMEEQIIEVGEADPQGESESQAEDDERIFKDELDERLIDASFDRK